MRSDVLEKLGEFTNRYHAAVSAALEQHGRGRLPHHGEKTVITSTFHASDGFATFYLPDPQDPSVQQGVYAFDYSSYSLDQVCQALSVHRLKIATVRPGQEIETLDLMPPDAPPIPGLQAPWFHPEVRRLALERKLTSLQGMTVTPIMDVKVGVIERILPCRVKIWSPVFTYPEIGDTRLYLWTHADFWWSPESLDLSEERAHRIALDDVLAILTLASLCPQLPPEIARKDAPTAAADLLDEICNDFERLLDEHGNDEETIHQWLYEPAHRIFLDPGHAEIRSKVPMGKKQTDFVIRRANGIYVLTEIERADRRIYTKKTSEPTHEFKHAETQVHDWMSLAQEHVQYLRDVEGLVDFANPRGMIVMGRTADIDSDEARKRWEHLKRNHQFELFTYDDLIDRVRSMATNLRHTSKLA